MQVNYKYSINSFFTVNLTCEFCSKNARRYLPYGKEFINQRSTTYEAIYKFSGKERDLETGYGYFGARYYSSELGIWISTDPMAGKYPSSTPYAYCRNNPIMLVDPNGMDDEFSQTKYVNQKGELLHETNDGLKDIVVIDNSKVKSFEKKLNELYQTDKLNDADANRQELHSMGTQLENVKDEILTGTPSLDVGIKRGYDEGYNDKKPSFLERTQRFLFGIEEENAKINSAHVIGKTAGNIDREKGNINKLDPYSSLKTNEPLIKVPNLKQIERQYHGKGLPPK
jgi:RHS repeat-associated protein